MRPEEPDWSQLTHRATDPAKLLMGAGLAAIALGLVVLFFDAARRGSHLDAIALGLGLIAAGAALRR